MVEGELIHQRWMLFVGVGCFIFFGAFAILSQFTTRDEAPWWSTAMFIAFSGLGAVLWVAYTVEKHALSQSGIDSRTWLGLRKSIAWQDLRSVRYLEYPRACFRLEDNSGNTVQLSLTLVGLDILARMLISHAPERSIDAITIKVLKETAAGVSLPLKR